MAKKLLMRQIVDTVQSISNIYIIVMHLADTFMQSDLQCIQAIHVLSVCVPWELNP